ncbi:MAG: hypothetical protein NC938_04720 [Candidatus Omnitrophica bacterium]|nr:hypothetical protein [Candidatus Omnitrophota bacterium]MCM8790987.1 hypothetical protein [Candidatus Omnitrophota bacterium]
MRHIRTRRRFKAILIVLLVLCIILLVETRIEALVPELKRLAEARVEEMFGGKVKLFIGSIEGGIVNPISLNGIKVKQAKSSVFLQSLEINSIKTKYHLWEVLRPSAMAPVFLEKDSPIYANFSMCNGSIKGFTALEGDLTDSSISGWLIFFGKSRVDFKGTVKGDIFDMEIRPERPDMGLLRLVADISDDGILTVNIKAYHLKLYGFDVVCDVVLKNNFVKSSDGCIIGLNGELETRRLVINYKQVAGLKAKYSVSNGALQLHSLSLGDFFRIYGRVGLKNTVAIDLTILANNLSLNWLIGTIEAKEASSIITGTLNGKFSLKGLLHNMKVASDFEIRNGTIGPLDFENLSATIKGDLPFLKIEDSHVMRKSGYFALAGEIDMRRAGKASLFDNIKLVTDDGAISWDDWSSMRVHDGRKVSMKKNVYGNIDIEYKRIFDDSKIDESLRDSDEVRLEYKLQPTDSLKLRIGQDDGFFGFEHKDRF